MENFRRILNTVAKTTVRFSVVFAIIVAALLAIQFRNLSSSQPLNAPELSSLREEFVQKPSDELKEKIRELDFVYRRAWFSSKAQFDFGVYLLIGTVVLLLLSMQIAELSSDQVVTKPGDRIKSYFAAKSLSRKLLIAGSIVAVLLIFIQTYDKTEAETEVVEALPGKDALLKNWTSFRGLYGLGFATGHSFTESWNGEDMKNILWKQSVEMPGFSSPLIWNGKLILTGGNEEQRTISCYNAESGDVIWNYVSKSIGDVPEVSDDTGFAASSPATDGRYIYTAFATGDLVCVDFEGKLIWTKNLGVPENPYGYSSSMLVEEGKLIVQYDDEAAQILYALDSKTGNVVWQTKRDTTIGWSSPALIDTEQGKVVVILTSLTVEGFDFKTGKQLWNNECMRGEVAPSPTFGNGKVFVANDNACAAAIDPLTGKSLWENEDIDLPDVSSPLFVDGMVYLFTSGGIIVCLDAETGEMLWDQETDEGFYSSAILVDGKIVVFDMIGTAFVIKPNRENYVEVSRNELGEGVVATPVFCNGKMYIRAMENLYCIGEK